jgi:DNA polymerase I
VIDLNNLRAFDTETHLIAPGNLAPRIVCASIAGPTPGDERVVERKDALRTFRGCIAGRGVIGGHNLCYDFGVMAAEWPELVREIFKVLEEDRAVDSGLLEALDSIALGCLYRDRHTNAPIGRYTLAYLEGIYRGVDRSESKGENSWRLRYSELDGVPLEKWPGEAVQYPRDDARGTYEVLKVQLVPPAGERRNVGMIHQEMRAAWALHLISTWGLRTDPELTEHVVGAIQKEHDESREKFLASGIVKTRKCKKVKGELERVDFWDDITGIEIPMRYCEDKEILRNLVSLAYAGNPPLTAGGVSGDRKVATDRDTLVNSGNELLEEYGEAGPNEKLLSTYSELLTLGTEIPINPSYTVILESDRTSCSKPNIQQLPRKSMVRNCFVPRDGWVFVSVDYSSLELVTLAKITLDIFGHSAMADAINAGRDLHLQLAANLSHKSYEEALALKKAGDKQMLALRQVAKPTNFGTPGGMGAPKQVLAARKEGTKFCEVAGELEKCGSKGIVYNYYNGKDIAPTCVVCLDIAERAREAYLSTWREMPEYFRICSGLAEGCQNGTPVESLSQGGLLRLEPSFCAVANHGFQNLAAVGAKDALWEVSRECYADPSSILYGNCRPVAFIHDEVFSEIREEVLTEAANRKTEIMIATMQKHCVGVKVGAEPAACRRWFKNASAVHDADGRLIPWWPTDWAWGPDQKKMAYDRSRLP